MKRSVLITGGNGFVGKHLVASLLNDGFQLHVAIRTPNKPLITHPNLTYFSVGNVDSNTDWRQALKNCVTVIHLAGASRGDSESLEKVNNFGTRRLVEQSAEANISTFVFLSSIAVLDHSSSPVTDFTPASQTSSYGLSKIHAEYHVEDFQKSTGGSAVIIRPPLIYGPGAKGKWKLLCQAASLPIPLPVGSLRERRTLLSVGNLVSAIAAVIRSGNLAGSSRYVVGDSDAVSVAETIEILRTALGHRRLIINVPKKTLDLPFRLLGRPEVLNRMFGKLEIDSSRFKADFNWSPPGMTKTEMIKSILSQRKRIKRCAEC